MILKTRTEKTPNHKHPMESEISQQLLTNNSKQHQHHPTMTRQLMVKNTLREYPRKIRLFLV